MVSLMVPRFHLYIFKLISHRGGGWLPAATFGLHRSFSKSGSPMTFAEQ
jgi:hypothetical protein